jgi:hypothetical protein
MAGLTENEINIHQLSDVGAEKNMKNKQICTLMANLKAIVLLRYFGAVCSLQVTSII